jgi:hypothetical protein
MLLFISAMTAKQNPSCQYQPKNFNHVNYIAILYVVGLYIACTKKMPEKAMAE